MSTSESDKGFEAAESWRVSEDPSPHQGREFEKNSKIIFFMIRRIAMSLILFFFMIPQVEEN